MPAERYPEYNAERGAPKLELGIVVTKSPAGAAATEARMMEDAITLDIFLKSKDGSFAFGSSPTSLFSVNFLCYFPTRMRRSLNIESTLPLSSHKLSISGAFTFRYASSSSFNGTYAYPTGIDSPPQFLLNGQKAKNFKPKLWKQKAVGKSVSRFDRSNDFKFSLSHLISSSISRLRNFQSLLTSISVLD